MDQMLTFYRDCLREPLEEATDALFLAADVALMKLASHAQDNHEQNRHFDEVLDVRIHKPEISMRFVAAVFGTADALPFQQEVADVDQEEIESLQRMMTESPSQWPSNPALFAALTDLQRRHETQGWQPSPLDPVTFVRHFIHALAGTSVSMHCKMLLMRLFESRMYRRLQVFATHINRRLIAMDVLPELQTAPPELDQSMDQIVERELNRRSMYIASGEYLLEQLLEEAQVEAFEVLEDTLDSQKLLRLEEPLLISDWLNVLKASDQWPEKEPEEMQAQLQLVKRLQQFFSGLLVDQNMPLMARYLLDQLQLPYLRLVLADASFFSEQGHAAQKLLAELVALSHTWQVPRIASEMQANRFYSLFVNLVRECVEAERIYDFDFHSQLAEFIALQETQRQQLKIRSQQLVEAEAGASHAQTARETVDALLDSRLSHLTLAEDVDTVVLEDFSHVLYKAALNGSTNSKNWVIAVKLLDRLLASLRPASSFTSRHQFLRLIGPLLRDLRVAYESIGIEPGALLQHFAILEKNHKRIVVAIDAANDGGEDLASADVFNLPDAVSGFDSAAAEVDESVVQALGLGTWLNWHRGDTVRRCQVAAYIKHADKYILTSRSGDRMGDLTGAELANLLESGDIVIVKSGPAFESALESVIGGIRGQGGA